MMHRVTAHWMTAHWMTAHHLQTLRPGVHCLSPHLVRHLLLISS